MAGARLDVQLDDQEVQRAIRGLIRQAARVQPALDEAGAALVTSTQQRFMDEEDPAGTPWPRLAPSTQRQKVTKRRRRGSENILRRRGHLFQSITHIASGDEVQVGSARKYAALHQFGGESDMPPGPAAVPARAFLGISGDDESEIGRILVAHMEEPL